MATNLYIVYVYKGITVAHGEVASLDHEVRDDSVESGPLVVQGLAANARLALLAGAKRSKVLGGTRDGLSEESKDNAAGSDAIDSDVEEHLVGDLLEILASE